MAAVAVAGGHKVFFGGGDLRPGEQINVGGPRVWLCLLVFHPILNDNLTENDRTVL